MAALPSECYHSLSCTTSAEVVLTVCANLAHHNRHEYHHFGIMPLSSTSKVLLGLEISFEPHPLLILLCIAEVGLRLSTEGGQRSGPCPD